MAIAITIASIVVGLALIWLVWKAISRRLPDQLTDIVDQLFPVIGIAIVVVAILVAIDPDQAESLKAGVFSSIPKVLVAVIVVILARSLGRIVGALAETALGRVSPAMAARGRILLSSLILAVGVIIALQQLGISTAIILILVSAVAFGFALASALAIGLGAVPLARQVAAGRHVKDRHEEGQMVRVAGVEGRLASIGLATTRVEEMDGGFVEVPNDEFLKGNVAILS
ncbi:MAG: mechanosensitive ion channel family protein [Acidimicrobiia bacterium]|nr:mechanosensitive ion channel family protein [Acidimicrobiia bacterium]